MMGAALWWMYGVLLCSVIQHTSGQRLPDCSGDHDAVELTLGSRYQTTVCEDIAPDQEIEWVMGGVTMSTCNNIDQPCKHHNADLFTATRGSSVSTATFMATASRPPQSYGSYDLTCRPVGGSRVACPIDVVYAPTASEVNCSVSSTDSGNITVSCTVHKAYSGRDRYTCDFRQGERTGPSLGKSNYSSSSPSSDYVSGDCSLNFATPTSNGTYSYTVIVYPGVTAISAGSVTVTVSGSLSISPGVTEDSGSVRLPTVKSTTTTNAIETTETTTDELSSGSLALTSVPLMTVTFVTSQIL